MQTVHWTYKQSSLYTVHTKAFKQKTVNALNVLKVHADVFYSCFEFTALWLIPFGDLSSRTIHKTRRKTWHELNILAQISGMQNSFEKSRNNEHKEWMEWQLKWE